MGGERTVGRSPLVVVSSRVCCHEWLPRSATFHPGFRPSSAAGAGCARRVRGWCVGGEPLAASDGDRLVAAAVHVGRRSGQVAVGMPVVDKHPARGRPEALEEAGPVLQRPGSPTQRTAVVRHVRARAALEYLNVGRTSYRQAVARPTPRTRSARSHPATSRLEMSMVTHR